MDEGFDSCRFDFRIDAKNGLTPSRRKKSERRSGYNTLFKCKTCGSLFDSRPALLTHKLTHNPINEWTCPICECQSAGKMTLEQHLRKTHCIGNAPKKPSAKTVGNKSTPTASLPPDLMTPPLVPLQNDMLRSLPQLSSLPQASISPPQHKSPPPPYHHHLVQKSQAPAPPGVVCVNVPIYIGTQGSQQTRAAHIDVQNGVVKHQNNGFLSPPDMETHALTNLTAASHSMQEYNVPQIKKEPEDPYIDQHHTIKSMLATPPVGGYLKIKEEPRDDDCGMSADYSDNLGGGTVAQSALDSRLLNTNSQDPELSKSADLGYNMLHPESHIGLSLSPTDHDTMPSGDENMESESMRMTPCGDGINLKSREISEASSGSASPGTKKCKFGVIDIAVEKLWQHKMKADTPDNNQGCGSDSEMLTGSKVTEMNMSTLVCSPVDTAVTSNSEHSATPVASHVTSIRSSTHAALREQLAARMSQGTAYPKHTSSHVFTANQSQNNQIAFSGMTQPPGGDNTDYESQSPAMDTSQIPGSSEHSAQQKGKSAMSAAKRVLSRSRGRGRKAKDPYCTATFHACRICKQLFDSSEKMWTHMITHQELYAVTHKCDECEFCGASVEALSRHKATMHPAPVSDDEVQDMPLNLSLPKPRAGNDTDPGSPLVCITPQTRDPIQGSRLFTFGSPEVPQTETMVTAENEADQQCWECDFCDYISTVSNDVVKQHMGDVHGYRVEDFIRKDSSTFSSSNPVEHTVPVTVLFNHSTSTPINVTPQSHVTPSPADESTQQFLPILPADGANVDEQRMTADPEPENERTREITEMGEESGFFHYSKKQWSNMTRNQTAMPISDAIQSDAPLETTFHMCKICKQLFSSIYDKWEHNYLVHQESHTKLHCPWCGFVTFSQRKLERHFQDKHPQDSAPLPRGKDICPVCGQLCGSAISMRIHMLKHRELPPPVYECEIQSCKMKYHSKAGLRNHMRRVHMQSMESSEQMLQCPHEGCGMCFTPSGMKRHLVAHSDDRPIVCDYPGCGQTFRESKHLRVHRLQHTDEKPLKCDSCEYSCRQRSSMNWHMKARHGRQKCTGPDGRTYYK